MGRGGPILTLPRLFVLIFKLVPFKKLNGLGQRDEKILIPHLIYLIFVFQGFFLIFVFIFIILKLIYFIKRKIL